jgi:hypothetical protein
MFVAMGLFEFPETRETYDPKTSYEWYERLDANG